MTYGGYWDKLGNQFEDGWALHQLVLMTGPASDIESLEREPVGQDEPGVDLWVNRRGGQRECHQCKRAKEGRVSWSMLDLHNEGILGHLKYQIERAPTMHLYRLISRTPARNFDSLLREARDSRDADSFWQHQVQQNQRLGTEFAKFCGYLDLREDDIDRQCAWRLLRSSGFVLFSDDECSMEALADKLQSRLEGNARTALEVLKSWLQGQLRRRINLESVAEHLRVHGFHLIRGETDRFRVAGAALARKRAQHSLLPMFEAELAELQSIAEKQCHTSSQLLGGEWLLLGEIARGGIAEVWHGIHRPAEGTSRLGLGSVAVKLLRADKSHDPAIVQMFQEGANRMRAILHPAVTLVLSAPCFNDGRFYYVMEYVDAPTLEWWIKEGQVPSAAGGTIVKKSQAAYGAALWDIVTTVGAGIAALHKEGLVHGDIKPSNILVDRRGRAKLCDFDLVDSNTCGDPDPVPLGTKPFLAPEVLGGRSRTVLSDQFSFAVTLIAIISGGNTISERAAVDTAKLGTLACAIGLKACLQKALSPDPQKRYESIDEFLKGIGPEAFRGTWL